MEKNGELQRLREELKVQKELVADLEDTVRDLEENMETTREALMSERSRREEIERRLEMEMVASENLKAVLDDFEVQRETAEERLRQQLKDLEEAEAARRIEAEESVKEVETMKAGRDNLEQEVLRWKAECLRTKEEMLSLKDELEKALGSLNDDEKAANSVDRRIIRQLVVGSFRKSDQHRLEVLELMAKILELSEEERVLIGLRRRRNLRAIFKAIVVPPPAENPMPLAQLSEKWIEFLTKETEKGMIEDSSRRSNGTADGEDF